MAMANPKNVEKLIWELENDKLMKESIILTIRSFQSCYRLVMIWF